LFSSPCPPLRQNHLRASHRSPPPPEMTGRWSLCCTGSELAAERQRKEAVRRARPGSADRPGDLRRHRPREPADSPGASMPPPPLPSPPSPPTALTCACSIAVLLTSAGVDPSDAQLGTLDRTP
jgi:hypothetical protein